MNQSSVGKKHDFFKKNQPTKMLCLNLFILFLSCHKSGVSNLRKSLKIEFQTISCRILNKKEKQNCKSDETAIFFFKKGTLCISKCKMYDELQALLTHE